MDILVIDIGGSHIKLMHSKSDERRKLDSGARFSPRQFLAGVRARTKDWKFDAVSIGFPAPIVNDKPIRPPHNLGKGWKDFDFNKAFNKPVKVVNDAAMQALGSYEGGRMLFLGLGTGLGSCLIVDNQLLPMELCELRWSSDKTIEDCVSKRTLKKVGAVEWQKAVHEIVATLQRALLADYVVLGGGNAKKLEKVPPGARRGANENAFLGGLRLWEPASVFAPKKKRAGRE